MAKSSITGMEVIPEFTPERVAKHFPIEKEPKIMTMAKPVIIESACPGWQVGGARYPAVPISIEDQIQETIDSVRAGAIAVHMHPRDPKTGNAKADPKLLAEILGPVFKEVGDFVTISHTWSAKEQAEYITETDKLLELGSGNKYCQGSVVLRDSFLSATGAFHTAKNMVEGIQWLEAHDVKPVFQLYDTYVIWDLKQKVLDTGIAQSKPYVFNLHMGKHHAHAIQQDPWSYLQLITNYNMVLSTASDSIVGVYPGGRNWLPILVLGLMMGTQLVRVGIEDCYWVYPHKDEVIKKNSDMVTLAREIAERLGRRVVTDPTEARAILGMKLTSR
ncbi:MAG: 3-keto-5-aminohexanoate cleavage protein [Desulfobaccales bacterium]